MSNFNRIPLINVAIVFELTAIKMLQVIGNVNLPH